MEAIAYDIFAGPVDHALWLETVEDLDTACERMKKLAEERPGPYFVFRTSTRTVLASIDRGKSRIAETAKD